MNPHLITGGAAALLQRWDRIALGIRLAYNPRCGAAVHHYLALGQRLVQLGLVDEAGAMQRMLRLLLQTAHDEALPWLWRSFCLEHTTWPLARLRALLKLHDPLAAELWQEAVQAAHQRLGPPPCQRLG